jgi:PAS domain S-box-containing protein
MAEKNGKRKGAGKLDSQAIMQASDDAIIAKTMEGTIVAWNKGAEKLYGYKAEEILGLPISVLIPPHEPDELNEIMERVRQGKSLESYETTRLHKSGAKIDVRVTISPIQGDDGIIVGASVVAHDISRQKQAEAALRLSEERFQVALKHAPVTLFSQDLQLGYTWVSAPILAWGRQNYIGRTDAEIIGGEEGDRLTVIKEEVLRSGAGLRTEVTVTYEGVSHYFDLVVMPFRDLNGRLLGVVSTATDTTPWKELIAKLQATFNEVKMLRGLLSLCSSCKKIRDECGNWQPLEKYIHTHSEAKFSHGLCSDCLQKLYPSYLPE